MSLSRRALLTGAASVTAAGFLATSGQSAAVAATPTADRRWISGVVDDDPDGFGDWRGSAVGIAGMYADQSLEVQLQEWAFSHSTFDGDVDLAVGGPIDHTWAQTAAGAEVANWREMAAVLRENWHYRTVYLRFAHEFNGTWMPWSVSKSQVPAFKKAFALFASTMRSELRGKSVKIVFAPNFGTWSYTPDSCFPGADVIDVVGVSMYEWTPYDTQPKWKGFLASPLGPNVWSAYAARHGRPLALSEWGAVSTLFLRGMNAWMHEHGGSGPGQLLYDVYMNDQTFTLTGATADQYRALTWG